jgi:hypothetical protein
MDFPRKLLPEWPDLFSFVRLLQFGGVSAEIDSDFAELFESGFKVIGDFLHEHVGPGKVAGFFAALLGSRPIGS